MKWLWRGLLSNLVTIGIVALFALVFWCAEQDYNRLKRNATQVYAVPTATQIVTVRQASGVEMKGYVLAGDEAIANCNVELWSAQGYVDEMRTGSDGFWGFRIYSPGNYQVRAELPKGYECLEGGSICSLPVFVGVNDICFCNLLIEARAVGTPMAQLPSSTPSPSLSPTATMAATRTLPPPSFTPSPVATSIPTPVSSATLVIPTATPVALRVSALMLDEDTSRPVQGIMIEAEAGMVSRLGATDSRGIAEIEMPSGLSAIDLWAYANETYAPRGDGLVAHVIIIAGQYVYGPYTGSVKRRLPLPTLTSTPSCTPIPGPPTAMPTLVMVPICVETRLVTATPGPVSWRIPTVDPHVTCWLYPTWALDTTVLTGTPCPPSWYGAGYY